MDRVRIRELIYFNSNADLFVGFSDRCACDGLSFLKGASGYAETVVHPTRRGTSQ